MKANPYIQIWKRSQKHKWRQRGIGTFLSSLAFVVLAAVVSLPLFQMAFLHFLADPVEQWGLGLENAVWWLSASVLAVVTIDLYEKLLRGEQRARLEIWPVEPYEVVRAVILQTGVERLDLLFVFLFGLSPLAFYGQPTLFIVSSFVVFGTYLITLAVAPWILLAAVTAASSERIAPLLDLLRGQNPREQAAFLYAPGVVLAVVGLWLTQATNGLKAVLVGDYSGLVVVALAPLALGLSWWRLNKMAPTNWFMASCVLADIDARYALIGEAEESSEVYLQFMVRWLPQSVQVHALKKLRHGWRGHRTAVLSVYLGLFAAITALFWQQPLISVLIMMATVWGVAFVVVAMANEEPEFLEHWLLRSPKDRALARGAVILAWSSPMWVVSPFLLWLRAPGLLLIGLAMVLVTVVVAVLATLLLTKGARGRLRFSAVAFVGFSMTAVGASLWM